MKDIQIYSSTQVLPLKIVQNFGLVNVTAKYNEGAMREQTAIDRATEVHQGCLNKLKEKVKNSGGNALVNFRITSGAYQKSGSGYNTHVLYASGDAVLLSGE